MKNILDKINKADEIQAKKVELGKHEVELGVLDEINTLNSQGEKLRQGVNKFYSLQNQMIAYAKDERGKLMKLIGDSEKLIKNAENKAKELGIDINDNATYKSAKMRFNETNDIFKIYTDYLNKV